jgi:hypothetical protein
MNCLYSRRVNRRVFYEIRWKQTRPSNKTNKKRRLESFADLQLRAPLSLDAWQGYYSRQRVTLSESSCSSAGLSEEA